MNYNNLRINYILKIYFEFPKELNNLYNKYILIIKIMKIKLDIL